MVSRRSVRHARRAKNHRHTGIPVERNRRRQRDHGAHQIGLDDGADLPLSPGVGAHRPVRHHHPGLPVGASLLRMCWIHA